MKALAKVPEERYQSGQELVNDLERCKESAPKKEAKKTAAAPAKGLNVPQAAKPAVSAPAQKKSVPAAPSKRSAVASPVPAKAAAAAAGWESAGGFAVESPQPPKEVQAAPKAVAQNSFQEQASALAEAEETAVETPEPQAPAYGVDPAMAEAAEREAGRGGPSFSEISELPPMKEIYTPPPPPPAAAA